MKTAIEIQTGMTRVELEKFYIDKINQLISFGMDEADARQMIQEVMLETLEIKL